MKRIFVFTIPDCPYCNQLKTLLLENNLSFHEWNIMDHEDDFLQLIGETGQDYVPSVWVKDGENNTYVVPERDFKSIPECLEKVKQVIEQ